MDPLSRLAAAATAPAPSSGPGGKLPWPSIPEGKQWPFSKCGRDMKKVKYWLDSTGVGTKTNVKWKRE